jgi:hypothetical protein
VNNSRIFILCIRSNPGVDAIRALRCVLKRLPRDYGFICTDIREIKE